MAKHIEKDHKLWFYAFYMVHLHTMDISDHNGVESYVFRCYVERDISWMPAYRALCIEEVGGSVIDDSQGGDEGGQEEAEDTTFVLDALFLEWNKYILGINKQIEALIEKKKNAVEAEEKKRLASQPNSSQILPGEVDRSQVQ